MMTKHARTEGAPGSPMESMPWWNATSYGAFFDAYGKWLANAARLQEESMRFARARMQRNIEAATGFAACRTPADLMTLQSQYASETMSDYLGEGRKVVDILKG